MEEQLGQLLSHVKGSWKYRWYAAATSWVVAVAGWGVVYTMPDNYESSARIYVDTQSVLQPLMSGMAMTYNVDQQVAIMSRTLISRPNVERVMRMVDLDVKAKSAKDRELLIGELTDKIRMGSAGNNLYTISYTNDNPKVAKDVVQSLLTIFVEGGLADKKKGTDSAIQFIDEQIKIYEQKLISAENALKEFKQRHLNLGNGDYVGQLSTASTALEQARLELKEAEQSRDSMRLQLEALEPSDSRETIEETTVVSNPEIDARIQELNKKLDALRLSFTERHPDVISTKRLIEQLEERKKQESKVVKSQRSVGGSSSGNPMKQQMQLALAQAESRVAAIKARVGEFSARYNQLRSMSNAVPEVEAELAQLNRDYGINKTNYEQLLQRRDNAKMSGDLNETSELVSFRIIDPPVQPVKPSGPNRLRLFSVVLAAALGVGLFLAFLLNQIRPTFHSTSVLRDVTGRPVLGVVAKILTPQERMNQRKGVYKFSGALLLLLLCYAALMAMTFLKGA